MKKEDAKALFKRVRNNADILHNCQLHDFEELADGEIETSGLPYKSTKMGKRYKCKNCGGQLDSTNVNWATWREGTK